MAEREEDRVAGILSAALSKNLINDSCPSIDAFDLDYFRGRLDSLRSAFPEDFFLHAVALKANSIRGILTVAAEKGFGAECASISEVVHALSLNIPPHKVVYDSPIKTRPELERAIKSGVVINLDNEHEMEIIDDLFKTSCKGLAATSIGLRINPVVGAGSIDIMSTATKASKFGLPVTEETRSTIIGLYAKYDWLNGIHFHVGSQGVPLDLFVAAARFCVHIVDEIENVAGRKLKTVDIGGGLSTSYTAPKEPENSSYQLYRARLEEAAPELFTGKYRLITEFGRSLFLKAGMTFTRIDYVKHWIPEIRPILLTHVGSNQFIREVYHPAQWRHRHSVADKDGVMKKSDADVTSYDIAGPLCFQGDFLVKDVQLPKVEAGDILIIHDTGAYTFSLYSRYNSILPSAVYGFESGSDGSVAIRCLKEKESPEEYLQFWGSSQPKTV